MKRFTESAWLAVTNPGLINLPVTFQEEIAGKMADAFGNGVLSSEEVPTPEQSQAMDELLEYYQDAYYAETSKKFALTFP
ncbi:hypothetical protein [Emticicia sp. 17c]|uniref:hypothetical protein n=1 Tax=Emticicia sp. 17c TaxID=3127704 RepID=UPI00301BD22B